MKKFKMAMEYYKKALKFDDKNPEIFTSIGLLYQDMSEYSDAIANFQKALDIGAKAWYTL